MASEEDSGSIGKFFVGLGIGIALAYAYVRFGYKPPAIVQLADKVTSEAVIAAAETSLYSPTATDAERQRAMAVVLGQQPELLVDMNNALGDRMLNEMLRRKALRKAQQLKHQLSAYSKALAQPAVRKRLEKKYGEVESEPLKRRMLAAAIHNDEFLCWYLRKLTPDHTDDSFVDVVIRSYQNELRPDRIAVGSSRGPRRQ